MTQEEINEGNRIIAEWMGGEITHTEAYEMPHGSCSKGVINYWKFPLGVQGNELGNFKYDTSWDWLMPVVEKIETVGFVFAIIGNHVVVMDERGKGIKVRTMIGISVQKESKIHSVYQAVIEFIKWHKQQ